MIGPKGKELPLQPGAIELVVDNAPVLQPVWGGGSALHWEIDLSEAYALSETGIYRLYYSYRPPPSTDAKELAKPTELMFWDGREYVNYYEFKVRRSSE